MEKYIIVKSSGYDTLEEKVNEFIRDGYVPCGGMAIEHSSSYGDGNEGIGSSNNVFHECIYYQPMFNYGEK